MGARIELKNVGLDVPIYIQRERESKSWTTLMLGAAFDPPKREFRSLLSDISLEIGTGDRLAILGRNGAGKSTLLRVLNGVFQPTRGHMKIEGSRQALLNLSLGFSGEATVRENIFLRGTAMGLKAAQLRGVIDSILDFAGLEDKSSHRLRTLSSGQRIRLGFAISTEFQHDIMLMDEWVGAGDVEFMSRAKQRMQNRVGNSKIVVLASHSLGLLRDVCNKGIVLEGGRNSFFGDITDALKHYQYLMSLPSTGEAAITHAGTGEGEVVQGGGEPGTTMAGSVEDIDLRDGQLTLRGWALKDFGSMPGLLAVDVDGERLVVDDFERLPRRDVQKHFGLLSPECGFRFRVPTRMQSLEELRGRIDVYGGDQASTLDGPFRVAPGVQARIRAQGS